MEFKKTSRIETIVKTLAEAESIVNKIDKIVKSEVDEVDDFIAISKMHGRTVLASMTLFWLIQKEEQKLFDLHNAKISEILDHINNSVKIMKEIILKNCI